MNSDPTPNVIIPLSKGKLILLLFGSIAFVAGSIWIWSISDKQTRRNPIILKCVAVGGASFFGLCGVFVSMKILDGRPGFIIDSEGFVDNSSAASAGRVSWEEVTGFQISKIAGQRFLKVEVVDPQKFIKQGHAIKQMLRAANTKLVGTPINISANSLRIDLDQLVFLLTKAFEEYHRDRQ